MTRAILVTGASSGIGKAAAHNLLDAGRIVIGCSRKIESENPFPNNENFIAVNLDVRNFLESYDRIKDLSDKYSIDSLINNAGITSFRFAAEESFENIHSILDTNLTGQVYLIKALLPKMIENRGGTIVNIQSVTATNVYQKSSIYAASKAGFLAYSRVLREEVRSNGIRVIDVIPGPTKTAIWPEDALAEFGERMMSAEDVGKVIAEACLNHTTAVTEEIVLRPQLGDL